jgi:hypothetical protein
MWRYVNVVKLLVAFLLAMLVVFVVAYFGAVNKSRSTFWKYVGIGTALAIGALALLTGLVVLF